MNMRWCLRVLFWGGAGLCGLLFAFGQSSCVLSTPSCSTGDDCPPPFQVCVNATCVLCRVDNDCKGSLVCVDSNCILSSQDGSSTEQAIPEEATPQDQPTPRDTPFTPELPETPELPPEPRSPEAVCATGQKRACYAGAPNTRGQAGCKEGTQECDTSRQWGPCIGQVLPQKESCNNLDDDCNGKIDDAIPGIDGPCQTGKQGLCGVGRALCVGGRSSCEERVQPTPEVCDGKDNDCNGKIDDAIPGTGKACVVPNTKGPCAKGKLTCVANKIVCTGLVKPKAPVCPGVGDLDCDGKLDCEIPIAAGSYMRGAPATDTNAANDERPQHKVTLTRKFTVWQHKITQGEYTTVIKTNPSRFKACGANCPVEMVSWHDTLAFANALSTLQGLTTCYDCRMIGNKQHCEAKPIYQANRGSNLYKCPGFRLPTDAEWEYVARAGTLTPLYTGKSPSSRNKTECRPDSNVSAVAWFCNNSTVTYTGCYKATPTSPCLGPSAVQQKTPNAWKVHDMLGSLREWVYDDAAPYRNGSLVDPIKSDDDGDHVVRGASFGSNALFTRVSNRRTQPNADAQFFIGFRVVRTLP